MHYIYVMQKWCEERTKKIQKEWKNPMFLKKLKKKEMKRPFLHKKLNQVKVLHRESQWRNVLHFLHIFKQKPDSINKGSYVKKVQKLHPKSRTHFLLRFLDFTFMCWSTSFKELIESMILFFPLLYFQNWKKIQNLSGVTSSRKSTNFILDFLDRTLIKKEKVSGTLFWYNYYI